MTTDRSKRAHSSTSRKWPEAGNQVVPSDSLLETKRTDWVTNNVIGSIAPKNDGLINGELEFKIADRSSSEERARRSEWRHLYRNCPIPENEMHAHLGLFLNRPLLSRIIYMQQLYTKILDVPGVVMEFGVRWGQNLALFEVLRGIYEPYNYTRKVIGFDTFSGFVGTGAKDGGAELVAEGAYSVTPGYERYLERLLDYHEKASPIPHIKKCALVKGDAGVTIREYLDQNPETIISLAHFNMDIYKPTAECLEAIKERVVKGSIIAFDELVCPHFPGETLALHKVFGLNNCRLVRDRYNPYPAYFVFE